MSSGESRLIASAWVDQLVNFLTRLSSSYLVGIGLNTRHVHRLVAMASRKTDFSNIPFETRDLVTPETPYVLCGLSEDSPGHRYVVSNQLICNTC
jgi:hypothetical protein